MRCEIQIQTILNHAWAEMAHDTIYKAPVLDQIGGRALDQIKGQMRKIARKYLVPAGFEFQKLAHDFDRLIQGKSIFENEPLDAIVDAANNNDRWDALERFKEQVLPLYDDLEAVMPTVVNALLDAARRASDVAPAPIETPYGIRR